MPGKLLIEKLKLFSTSFEFRLRNEEHLKKERTWELVNKEQRSC